MILRISREVLFPCRGAVGLPTFFSRIESETETATETATETEAVSETETVSASESFSDG